MIAHGDTAVCMPKAVPVNCLVRGYVKSYHQFISYYTVESHRVVWGYTKLAAVSSTATTQWACNELAAALSFNLATARSGKNLRSGVRWWQDRARTETARTELLFLQIVELLGLQYSHAPHNDVSVNDGPHIRRRSLKIVMYIYTYEDKLIKRHYKAFAKFTQQLDKIKEMNTEQRTTLRCT
jgi:hypothetical protein